MRIATALPLLAALLAKLTLRSSEGVYADGHGQLAEQEIDKADLASGGLTLRAESGSSGPARRD